MTKQLEKTFNLPPINAGTTETPEEDVSISLEQIQEQLSMVGSITERIDNALPAVAQIEQSDSEFDSLAKLAEDEFRNVIEMSYNVEPRHSAELVTAASSLLGHALHAKAAKLDRKLKTVQLQLKAAELELKERQLALKEQTKAQEEGEGDGVLTGVGQVFDRNALIQQIAAEVKKTT